MKNGYGVWIARGLLLLSGVLLIVLALLFPTVATERREINDPSRDKTDELEPGAVAEQQLNVTGTLQELKMATTNNRNTKNMSVHMTLTRGETVLAEDDFSLAKGTSGKVNMKLIPQSPVSLDGTEKVTLRMEGEGSAKIYGLSGGVGATVNGTPSETGLYVQMTLQTGSTPMSAAYLGIMLMLLGLAPLPGRKKHG